MKDGFVKCAAAGIQIKVADPVYNTDRILEKITECLENGARIIAFPEMCITGYTCNDLFLQEQLLITAKEQLLRIRDYSNGKDALIYVGLPYERMGKLYNVAAVIWHGSILAMIPKTSIPSYGEFYEGRYFTPGNDRAVMVNIGGEQVPFGTHILLQEAGMEGLMIGCEICEDLWSPLNPATGHALAGATLIINLSASNETIGKADYRRELVTSASARLLCDYLYVSAGEGESTQDVVFGGHHIIAENGTVLAEGKRFTGETVYADIDNKRIHHERRRMSSFQMLSENDYITVPFRLQKEDTKLFRTFGMTPFVPTDKQTREERCEEILSIQAHGLKKRYEHTGAKSAVIGVSGGLDSTLALLVTVRAFDLLEIQRKNITAVTMPCFGTTDRTYENACKLADTLGCTLQEINISFHAF